MVRISLRVCIVTILVLLFSSGRSTALTLELKPIATGLTNITSITAPRDGSGRLFITQQNGQIRLFDGTRMAGTNFLDIGTFTSYASGTERGLLSLAFHPGYRTNGLLFVTYNTTNGDFTLARFSVSANSNIANAASSQNLWRIGHSTNSNHNGGQLQFGPDGYLYLTTGDGGGGCDAPNNSQNLALPLGKMMRIDINTPTGFLIPPSNPFVSTSGVVPAIWAYGLRNPWKFSFDRVTGDLIIGDVGQDTREEVDFQPAGSPGGQNYGWRLYEGFCTNCCSVATNNVATTLPIFDYGHGGGPCAIIGGYRYRGSIEPLNGTYFYADYCTGVIWGAVTNATGGWTTSALLSFGSSISSFGEDEFGEIYAGSYSGTGGTVSRIVAHDSVGDGIADWWRQKYFGGAGITTNASSCAACDADGDGANNLQEYLAGTSPIDSASRLQVTHTAPNGTDFVILFPSVNGRLYRLQRTSDLSVTSVWTTVTDDITGTGAPISVTDQGATAQTHYFYRVRLLP